MDKKLIKQEEQAHEAMAAVDSAIFKLPDFAINHVLKFLSTRDAIRSSILSKQWEREWPFVPVLDFDEKEPYLSGRYPSKLLHTDFIDFVIKCLKRRQPDKFLLKFRLNTRYYVSFGLVDKCLNFAVKRNVKELYISLNSTGNEYYYCISHNVLNAKSLTNLNLEHVSIGDSHVDYHVNLPSLKSLSLRNVKLCELGFVRLLLGCPSIENLLIDSCSSPSNLEVSSSSLKSLEVILGKYDLIVEALNLESFRCLHNLIDFTNFGALRNLDLKLEDQWFEGFESRFPFLESLSIISCLGLSNVIASSSILKSLEVIMGSAKYDLKVEVPNLKSFRLSGTKFVDLVSCNNIDVACCGALRNLDLVYVEFEDQWFEDFNLRFPLLDSLTLNDCPISKHMNIFSQHLKRFVLQNDEYNPIPSCTIHTPSLHYFGFRDRVTCPKSEVCMNAPNLSEATIQLKDSEPGTTMFSFEKSSCIRNFLANFDSCGKVLTVYADNPKAFIFPENTREECCPPFPSLKHLKVTISVSYPSSTVVTESDMLDSLHWMAPSLEFLSVKHSCFSEFSCEIRREMKLMGLIK